MLFKSLPDFLKSRCPLKSFRKLTTKSEEISASDETSESDKISAYEEQYRTPFTAKWRAVPKPLYGGRNLITLIPGHGVGPELTEHTKELFKVLSAPVDFETVIISEEGEDLEKEIATAVQSIKRNGAALKGNVSPVTKLFVPSTNVVLREELDLFVNFIHYKSLPAIQTRHSEIDVVLVRQNTQGEYTHLEHENLKGIVESMKIVTRRNTKRLAQWAFNYAKKHKRKKVTVVHKADILKLSDGLFLNISRNVAKKFPDIELNDITIDKCALQLVLNPNQFDILLAPNLYGTIVSNIVCGLLKGVGIYSGINYSRHYAIFESSTRHDASTMVGLNTANPIAMFNAALGLLEHLGHRKYAKVLKHAIFQTLCVHKIHTPDLGGKHSTTDVVEDVIQNIAAIVGGRYLK